jgi:general secretion pathway protein G
LARQPLTTWPDGATDYSTDDARHQSGLAFSLMELIAVVAILGVVAALIVPRLITGTDLAKEKACFHNRAEINITVERYYMHNDAWPANDLSNIGADLNYFPDGLPTCPVSGQAYRLDPVTHRVVGHATSGDHSP